MTIEKTSCILFIFLCLFQLIPVSFACKGCVSLDEFSFEKIVPKFKVVLVKFDIAYPYGDKHDTFVKFADEQTGLKDFLLAEVGIKEYGEKENEEFAKRFGVDSKNLPAIRLFTNDLNNPIKFTDDLTVENLRRFITTNTEIHLVLPGCLEAYDMLVADFISSTNKKSVIEKAESFVKELKDTEKAIAKNYIAYMKKVEEKGVSFVQSELTRLKKLIKDGKIIEKKKTDLNHRMNILYSFKYAKDEL